MSGVLQHTQTRLGGYTRSIFRAFPPMLRLCKSHRNSFYIFNLRRKSQRVLEKNTLGFFPDPALPLCHMQSAWKNRVESSSRWLYEETILTGWPLKFEAEVDKRSQTQWKNSHVITTQGRYGVTYARSECLQLLVSLISQSRYCMLLNGDQRIVFN